MGKIPRILVVLTNGNDACSWYRGIGPWSQLAKDGLAEVWYSAKPAWQDVRAVDAVFMLRPCTKEMKAGAQAARDFGVPLIVDYDDDLLTVPTDNPSYAFFALPEIQQNYREFLQGCDAVMTTTGYLAETLRKISPSPVHVVPNAFDECLLRFRKPNDRQNSILWRGSSTHDRDVASVAPEIVAAAEAFPQLLWVFMGADPSPWAVSERIKRKLMVPKLEILPFFKGIYALAPKIVIVPLANQPFNRSKSNIAAIEGAFAGAAVIAPDWEEWRMPGVSTYTDPQSFGFAIRQLATNAQACHEKAELLWKHVMDELTLRKVNEKRIQIVRELIEAKQ